MHVGGCRQRPALGRFSPLSRAASVMLSEDCPSKARSTPRPRASESMKLGSAAWLSSAMGIDLLRLNEYWRFYSIIGQIGIIMVKSKIFPDADEAPEGVLFDGMTSMSGGLG